MLDDFRKQLKVVFENVDYNTEITEEDVPTNDFIHTGSDGVSYSVKVEPDENEFNVLDKSGKVIDIFLPTMVDMDGGLPKATRKAIMDDYNQNHSKQEAVAETVVVPPSCPMEEAAKKTKETHGGAKHGEGHNTKDEVKSKAAKSAHRQEANKEIKKEMIDEEKPGCEQVAEVNGVVKEENKINNFPLSEEKK